MTGTIVEPAVDERSKNDIAAVARGGAANLVGAVISAAANFALTVVIARYVSPAVAGVFFTVTSLFLMLETLGRLGATTGLVYFIARWRTTGRLERIRPGLQIAFAPVVVVCGFLAVVVLIFAPEIARLIGVPDGYGVTLLRLLALLVPVAAAYDLAVAATRGFGWMRPTVLVDKIGRSVLQLGLVVAVLALGLDDLLGYAWALPYLVGLVAVGIMLRNELVRRLPASFEPAGGPATRPTLAGQPAMSTRDLARRFWVFTAPRAVAGVAQVVLQRLDIVLVAAMRGATEAAIYTAATRFLVVGQFINQAITDPVQPQMSASIAAKDTRGARDLYRASTCWLVLVSWPLFGLTAALAPAYVGIFGHSYRSGASVVVILSLAMLVASAVGLVDTVIIMAGKSTWNLWTTLLALVVNVGVDVALIPHIGLVGAALGWLASILAANLVPLAISWRWLDMHPFGASTVCAYALCGGCWILIPWATYLMFDASIPAVAVSVALSLACYLAALWHWRDAFHLDSLVRRKRLSAAV